MESQSQAKKKRIPTLFWATQKLNIYAIENINALCHHCCDKNIGGKIENKILFRHQNKQ